MKQSSHSHINLMSILLFPSHLFLDFSIALFLSNSWQKFCLHLYLIYAKCLTSLPLIWTPWQYLAKSPSHEAAHKEFYPFFSYYLTLRRIVLIRILLKDNLLFSYCTKGQVSPAYKTTVKFIVLFYQSLSLYVDGRTRWRCFVF